MTAREEVRMGMRITGRWVQTGLAVAGLALAFGCAPLRADPQRLPTPVPAVLAPAPPAASLHPALWVVKDHDTTIYLFGTFHLLKPGLTFLSGPLAKALDQSGELVTEVVDPAGSETQKALLSRATLPPGQTLRALMPEKQRSEYEVLLAKIPLSPALLDRYKPWYAAVVLSSLPLIKAGLDPKSGAEVALSANVDARHVPHSALETADYQLGLFDSLPTELQMSFLASVMRDYDKIAPEIDGLVDAWGHGDADGLAKAMNADLDDPRLEEVLLIQRNKNWAAWVRERLHKPGTVFVAVGAGHLAGKGSVQAQLAAAGISAQRVQ
jgi:uncharacterized protein YbaP (TraB family)